MCQSLMNRNCALKDKYEIGKGKGRSPILEQDHHFEYPLYTWVVMIQCPESSVT